MRGVVGETAGVVVERGEERRASEAVFVERRGAGDDAADAGELEASVDRVLSQLLDR